MSFMLKAQTLYWVGGSGYWNDVNHWSAISGGTPVGTVPNSFSNVIFDDNSTNADIVIHSTQNVEIGSIQSTNQNYKIKLIGSPTVDLKINSFVTLNAHFDLDFNGKILLTPHRPTVYNFSHTIFKNEIKITANDPLELGVIYSQSKVTLSGNYSLKNSIINSKELYLLNANVSLNNTTLNAKTAFSLNNSNLQGINNTLNRLIVPGTNLSASQITALSNSNLSVTPPIPQACNPTLTGSSNPTCPGLCNGTATINLAGCSNPPYIIQWLNAGPAGPCQNLPPVELAFAGPVYTVNTLCGCGTQYAVLIENALGEQNVVNVGIIDPTPTLMFFSFTQPTCNGLCNGQIRANIISGTAPLTLNWNPPNINHVNIVTRDTLKNICANTYTVMATNANGCVNTFSTTLSQPAPLVANGSSSSITCNGTCNGSATVAPTGGTAPYNYSWVSAVSTPSTSSTTTIGNLCPGVVTMTVTDSKTCTATYSANITQPPAITLTVTKTNLNCGANCNGTASVTATGGIGAFSYSWAPSGGAASSASGLCAGNYTVTVTNNVNCIKTITVDILSPPTLTASPTQSNILCNAVCNGSVNLNTGGGTPNFTYSWTPSVSSVSTAVNLCAGAYTYTITDALGCTYTNTVTITQPSATTLAVTGTSISCNGACDGTATGNMSGGTGPYTYSWSPGNPTGQGTPAITNLCVGTYTLKVTDSNTCTITRTISITQPTAITVNVTTVMPSCNGLCNGSVNAVASGGTIPYTYTLQPSVGAPIVGNPPFNGLCAGSYTLSVKDNSGCTISQTINLTQPNPILLSLNSTPINCFNQCNASISTVVNGGTPAYTFTWSNGSNSAVLTNQCAGVYSSTVTDFFGCQATATVNITSPPDMTVAITPVNPNCNAQCTGVATAAASGGTPNYTFNWNNGDVGSVSSNLCAGSYTVTVHDFFGCIKTQTVAIITPPALTLTPVSGTVSCAGACNGMISVLPTGGTPGYSYSWNSLPTQNTQVATGLCVGNYIATVTDSKGCVAFAAANVSQPTVLTASISNILSSCNVCIGSATGNGNGGTPGYTYSWSNGQNTQNASNLCIGIYTLTVTDASGCVATETVNISQTIAVLVTSNGNTLACTGGCTGMATANASGGTGPGTYTYTWTPTLQNTQTAIGLCPGTYTVVASDANGCTNTDQITFVNPPLLVLNVTKTDVTCNGACNGTGSANASGGTGAITYLWQPGNFTTANVGGLCPNTYTVTASDANNCSQTQVITITQASSLTATFTLTNPSTCPANDGSILFATSGGVGPYTFTWTPGPSTNPLVNLGDGTYVLTIKDANNCLQSFTTTLSDPAGPTVTVNSSSITCFGSCTGAATLTLTGTGPFSVNWPAIPSTNTVVAGLCVGNYVATVTDANLCVTNQMVNIIQPAKVSSSGVVANATCNGACTASINLTPTGGTGPYTYVWSPAGGNVQDPVNLCANNYSVTISDANLCSVTNTFVVSQPAPLTLSFNKKDALCHGGCTGGVKAIVGNGTTPYSYTWTPSGANIDTIINLCAGIYTVTAADANGCTISGTVSIGEPTLLTATVTTINNLCNGQCNGSATLTPSGGIGPYSYSYNTGPVTLTQIAAGLCTGTYNGTVSDANNCKSVNSFTITQPLPIVVTTTVSNPLCNAVCNGSITTSVTGGTPLYSYSWLAAGGSSPNPTGLCAGSYTVTVTDNNLCTGVGLATLVNPPSLIANTSFTNPLCGAGCSGIVTANPIGGTGPFTYLWTAPANTNQTVMGLCAGNYTVVVTDANLCQSTQSVTLVPPSALVLNPAVTPASCGTNNGSISAAVSVGNPNYTYNWLPPITAAQSTFSVVTGIGAGIYTVVVTDASACTATLAIALSNSNGPSSATVTFTDVACNGQCNGAATISNPVGGTSPYAIAWVSPVAAGSTVSGLCAGTYTSKITDANNCVLFQPVTIAQPQTIDDNEVLNSAVCFGNCNGSIALNPSGGNGGYIYNWSTAASTSSISSLCPGAYSVTITDSKNCTFTANYNVLSLTTITSSIFTTNNNCFQNCNGTALATTVAGGLPPYSYNWTDPLGQPGTQAVGLCNGTYSVIITDANGCFNAVPATITSPSQVTFTPVISQPGCDQCNGAVSVSPVGGTPTYSLVWSNGQTGTNVNGLCGGVYMVQITDGNGCVSNTNVVINSTSGIASHNVTQADVSCAGVCDGSITVTAIGGVAPITYNWVHNNSSSQTQTNLCAGTYFCNMIDANGCSRTASVVINATSSLTITSQLTQSSCSSNTGSITVNVSGGTGTYTYAWLPAGNTATLTNLAPGSYTLTVTDGLGCSKTQVYSMGSINGPVVTFTKKDLACAGVCDGNIGLTINGGIPAYTIAWSNSATTPTITNLCAGAYSVQVTDAAGCKAVQNFSISNASPIIFSAPDSDDPKCHNDCNGSLTAIPVGGALPYVFTWTPGSVNGATTNSLCAGNYSINVVDANGCSAIQTYTLINPTVIGLTGNVVNASCNTTTDGSVDLTVTGGTPLYTYSWTPGGVTTQDLNNVLPGTYTVSMIDGNGTGCRKDTVFVITPAITVNALAGNDTTFCQNGSLQLNGSNSSGGITYQWFELPANTPVSNSLTVTVTPATGTNTYVLVATNGACVDSDTIVVTSNPLPLVDAGPFVDIPIFTTATIGGNPTAPAGSTISWLPALGLDNPTISNPTSSTTITTIYTVSIVDVNGCTNSDTVTVFVYPEIKIPNGFSPNGDGKNDVWQLDLIYLFPDNEVEVYNRWGEQLFYSKGYPIPFNGQYKGKNLPVGTYYYVIRLNHPSFPNAYTGPLTIFR